LSVFILCLLLGQIGERKVKRRAVIDFSFGPGSSAMPGDNPPNIGQANAGTFEFIGVVQTLEDAEKLST